MQVTTSPTLNCPMLSLPPQSQKSAVTIQILFDRCLPPAKLVGENGWFQGRIGQVRSCPWRRADEPNRSGAGLAARSTLISKHSTGGNSIDDFGDNKRFSEHEKRR